MILISEMIVQKIQLGSFMEFKMEVPEPDPPENCHLNVKKLPEIDFQMTIV